MLTRWMVSLIALLVAVQADAATLYVNNSGTPTCSDGTAKASNTSAAPWCTIGRAAWGHATRSTPNASEAAAAGDTVLVTAGTYSSVGTNTRYEPSLNPVNSGTAGNLITFRGVGTVELRLSSGEGPVIGSYNGKNYITWENFYIDEQYVHALPDMAPVVVDLSDYITLTRLTIVGRQPTWYGANDNHNGIRLEATVGSVVSNNRISGVIMYDGTYGVNAAGIMTYVGTGAVITIEHNEISDCGTGIYLKNAWGTHGDQITVRYNYLYDNQFAGIRIAESDNSLVYQNIIRAGAGSSSRGLDFGYEGGVNNIVANNTVVGPMAAGIYAHVQTTTWSNNTINNNIVYNVTNAVQFQASINFTGYASFDRNDYYTVTRWVNGSNYTTLADWQATAPAPDANSSTSDPQFVSAGTNNFHLANNGQAALTLGRVVGSIGGTNGNTIPVGAYITGSETIGVEGASGQGVAVISGGVRFIGGVRIQ